MTDIEKQIDEQLGKLAKMGDVRKRLSDLIHERSQGLTYDQRCELVLCVSIEDTVDVEQALVGGVFGEKLHDDHMIKGLLFCLPTFLGLTVLWFANSTSVRSLDELSKDDLLKVIESQRKHIQTLIEHRQRL